MLLLSKDQFVGYFTIDFSGIADDFTSFADQTEKKVLTDMFGKAMYEDMVANPTDPKYVSLIADYDLEDMTRDFFYYYYLRNRQSYSSTLGEFESEAQNATRSLMSRNHKITDVYNQGVELYFDAAKYVSENTDTYTLYTETVPVYKTNAHGIEVTTGINYTYASDWFIRGYG